MHQYIRQMRKKYDLEDRLIRFACTCIHVAEHLPHDKGGQVLEHQLVRSATSSALNYGEAQAAESKADFLHKIRLTLKEIRESRVALKIIIAKPYLANELVQHAFTESNELMAIFIQSIKTSTSKTTKHQ
jgi:four helix bundle protein